MNGSSSRIEKWIKVRTTIGQRQVMRQVAKKAGVCLEALRRTIVAPRILKNPDGKIRLNLGCGFTTLPGFINVDKLRARHIHYVRAVTNLRPFADDSVDLVYVSHCLEHVTHRKTNDVLAEWRRVLRPGGILRIGVPDFDVLLDAYFHSGKDIESIQPFLMGGQDYQLNQHLIMFTERSLRDRLLGVGFQEVRRWERNADQWTSLPDCTSLEITIAGRTFPISLNLEAVK